jgi:hypothetical protein
MAAHKTFECQSIENASTPHTFSSSMLKLLFDCYEVTFNDLIAVALVLGTIYQVAERFCRRELNQVMDALNAGGGTY